MKRLLLSALAIAAAIGAAPENPQLARHVESSQQRIRRFRSLPANMASRDLFSAAFVLAEANIEPESIEFALATAARMQDRDENSRGYGNLRWEWQDGAVLDYNAVEFCMQYGALMRIRHWDRLTPKAKEILGETIDYAIQGCLRHRVPESYTNIALMNAENLILLGQVTGRDEVLKEGKARLGEVCCYTSENGIHEYDSPTYYGVDLECLMFIHQFARDPEVLQQTEALLKLFWTDLAGNWHMPSLRLSGARSRDYNYLHGVGILDSYVYAAGWLPEDTERVAVPLVCLLADWQPDPALRAMCETTYPRLVEQRYGAGRLDVRTNYVTRGVALSSAGSNYGAMDLPFCLDFASTDRSSVRGYFIPDARRDPYGKKRIPAGGGHEKTLHLQPFWAATQQNADALGMVVYRGYEYPANPPSLESHFVFPFALDEIRIGEDVVTLTEGTPFFRELKPGEPVLLRQGKAAAGIRVPWTRSMQGTVAPVALVYDANRHGAVRITVAHHDLWGLGESTDRPGAAFWIRVADDLDDAAYATWRQAFATSPCSATQAGGAVTVKANGTDGPLLLQAAAPFAGCLAAEPPPHDHILAINGKEYGRELLGALPCVRNRRKQMAEVTVVQIAPDKPTTWEAEAGAVLGGMAVERDNEAFGGKFLWVPGKPGEKGGNGNARAIVSINVPQDGTYYLWGRVKTPTPDDDSFFVSLASSTAQPIQRADWHLGTHEAWEWTPFGIGQDPGPSPLQLTKGTYTLTLTCREDGAKIDQFLLSPDPQFQP